MRTCHGGFHSVHRGLVCWEGKLVRTRAAGAILQMTLERIAQKASIHNLGFRTILSPMEWISRARCVIIGCIICGNQFGNAIQICFCIYVFSLIYIILTSGLSPILHRSIKLTPLTLNFTRMENEPWKTVIFRPFIAALDLDVYRPTYTRPINTVGASSNASTSSKFLNY
jgi:hypothetical protein